MRSLCASETDFVNTSSEDDFVNESGDSVSRGWSYD